MTMKCDVCVVGGAGHNGAPLAIVLSDRELRTLRCDIDAAAVSRLKGGEMPSNAGA